MRACELIIYYIQRASLIITLQIHELFYDFMNQNISVVLWQSLMI